MEGKNRTFGRVATYLGLLVAFMFTVGGPASLLAATLTVNDGAGVPIGTGFRWLLQEDRMYDAKQGVPCDTTGADPARPCIPGTPISADTLSVNFHKSYMPPVDKGDVASGGTATITIPDPAKKYFVSVLPHVGATAATSYSISGASIARGQTVITVVVPSQPIPTAQVFSFAFKDNSPINNEPDQDEIGIGGFNVNIRDFSDGQVLTDTFGNPLGTYYNPDGSVYLLGSGIITTITQTEIDRGENPYNLSLGESIIKYLAPGKYGVIITPPVGVNWVQTATIEGGHAIDAWVMGKEPRNFEGGGRLAHHADFGFLQPFADATVLNGGGSISGRIVNNHMSRPPDYTMHKGHPLPGCWIGLNEFLLGKAGRGLYAGACNADSTFTIPNVPPGTYQLAIWDEFLDQVYALNPVTVTAGGSQNLGDVGVFRWFATHEHNVFFDSNQNGIRDIDPTTGVLEAGMRDQNINLRYRDGSIYQSFPTDTTGYVPFDEVFPFFNWLVAEVDYARFKPTGVTVTVDAGGLVAPGEKLNPQIQANGATTRTETGPVLLEGFQSFLGTLTTFDWGKASYDTICSPGQLNCSLNGGITGIVHYTTTRAEDDPRFAGAETWEPGIPRVPVFLYRKDLTLTTPDPLNPSKILNVNGVAGIQLSDVDNAPFGWSAGGAMGPEDVKRNNLGSTVFNAGDAVQITTTDSWEDHLPVGCLPGNAPGAANDPFYQNGRCYDGLRNYNQVREGAVFDGGLAFFTAVPCVNSVCGGWTPTATQVELQSGYYIVEAVTPKGYEHQKEEDKNVVFGDASVVSPLLLAPVCVGDPHVVPAELALFPGVATVNPGAITPLCDRKEVLLTDGSNAAADFFMFTEVPVAAQVTGLVLNDLANEFDPLSPNFSEKVGPSWIPISFRDWTGREVVRTYTDQYGTYNAMVPSTYWISAPTPSGVSPGMLQICLNNPGPIKDPVTGLMVLDPHHNKQYGQICTALHFMPGQTLYADTPILPIAAFVGPGNAQTDCECADRTPKIFSVTAPNNVGPFIANGATGTNRRLTITSLGTVQVPDPNALRLEGNLGATIARDFGFGSTPGQVTVGGIPLQNVSWSNSVIAGNVPTGTPTGQLVVTRSDSGFSTPISVTVTVGNAGIPNVRTVAPGQSIQAALDASVAGDLILVRPGSYYESVIMTKPVKLQGFGAGSTHLIPVQSLSTGLNDWEEKMNRLVNCPANQGGGQISLLPGQANNSPIGLGGTGICGFLAGTGLFQRDEGAGVFVATTDGVFTSTRPSRIDGFTITGSSTSPGIVVNGYARYLQISNNEVSNNQGNFGGGIRVGDTTIEASAQNDHVAIHHNHILQNGSFNSPGAGVALYAGSDNYQLTDNYVCGNYAIEDGAGVAHYGLSRDGLIARNKIVFNQTFVQSIGDSGGAGSGGGLLVAGLAPPVGTPTQISPGAGSVTIVSNLIQGNNAGSGDGAGVMLLNINGEDVSAAPGNNSSWYHIALFNNIIVNNVAGLAGGGIAMQDAARVTMINNTVAHNDSTATAGLAFTAGVPNQSNPQPAGIVSNRYSAGLCQAFGEAAGCARFSNPVMENNIVLNNRSMFWQVNTAIPPVGTLVIAGVNDLAVLPAGSGFRLNPRNGILTASTTGYHSSNQLVADSASVVANPYFNAPPGFGTVQPNGTILQLEFTTSLATAAALDEGGNYIDVHYGPLTPGGSYHLVIGSPAIDAGNDGPLGSFPFLATDYDGEPRPADGDNDGIARTDIGADELSGPVITSTPPLFAQVGVPYSYALIATSLHGPIAYEEWGTTNPANFSINFNTGVVTWTPTAAQVGNRSIQLQATDATGVITEQNFTVRVVRDGPPVITSTPPLTAQVGVPYLYTMHATDLDLPIAYEQWGTTNPTNFSINFNTGVVTWTPTAAQVGNRSIQLQATDAADQVTEQNFTVNVSPASYTFSPATLNFSLAAGVGTQTRTITITNQTNQSQTVTWREIPNSIPWLTPDVVLNASVPANGTRTITLTATRGTLTPGTYTGTGRLRMTINGTNVDRTVPVTMVLQ